MEEEEKQNPDGRKKTRGGRNARAFRGKSGSYGNRGMQKNSRGRSGFPEPDDPNRRDTVPGFEACEAAHGRAARATSVDRTDRGRRLRRVALLSASALLLGVGYLFFWRLTGIGFICPIKTFLKVDCPGCGITRAAFALLRFDFAGMLRANLLSPLIFLYVLYAAGRAAVGYILTGNYEVMPKHAFLNLLFLLLLLFYGVLRNTALGESLVGLLG